MKWTLLNVKSVATNSPNPRTVPASVASASIPARPTSKRGASYWANRRRRLRADAFMDIPLTVVINYRYPVELIQKRINAFKWMRRNGVPYLG